jgi:hypothetical protein
MIEKSPKNVTQSAGITPHEAEIISLNPSSPSCVDMSKKKKKNINMIGKNKSGHSHVLFINKFSLFHIEV